MDPKDKDRIISNLPALSEGFMVKDIESYLLQGNVLTFDNCEEIETEKTNKRKVETFIRILLTKGPDAYSVLCMALAETGSSHLVDLLNNTDITELRSRSNNVTTPSTLSLLQDELKEHYVRHLRWLSPIPWSDLTQLSLENVFTSMQFVQGVENMTIKGHSAPVNDEGSTKVIDLKDIFTFCHGESMARKVLIEGEPGIGKTTLSCKLAFDWAKGSCHTVVAPFSLVFLLKAKDLSSDASIEDLLRSHLLPDDFACDDLDACLRENQTNTLFIIDGFDEVAQPNTQVLKLLQSKLLSKCHILITARPGFMSSHRKCFDSVLLNIGYSVKQQVEFVHKFIFDLSGEKPSADFQSKLENDELVKDLCRNPLHLSIMCMLQCEQGSEVPTSNTELYQQMREFMIRRTSTKIEVTYDECVEKFKPLYKIAYVGLHEGKYRVKHDEIMEHIDVQTVLQSGFFSKEVQLSRFNQIMYYSYTHKSFQEFFAAEYILSKERTQRVDLLREIHNKNSCHMVILFLCGLLQTDKDSLCDIFDLVNEEIYLPKMREESMGVQSILDNHNGHLVLRCLSELSLNDGVKKLVASKLKIGHVCFSLLWCMEGCIDGLVKYFQALDAVCNCNGKSECASIVKATIQMQCLSSRVDLYRRLLHAVGSSKHGGYLHIHHIMSADQLALVMQILSEKPGITPQYPRTLVFHFLNMPDTPLSTAQMKPFPSVLFSLQCLMLYDCSNPSLLTQLLSLVMPCNMLEGLHIVQCNLDDATCKQLCNTLQKLTKLACFSFKQNTIHSEDLEFYEHMLEILSKSLKLEQLILSHLPSKRMFERRVSIKPIGRDSSMHLFPSLSRCLQTHQLTCLSVCNTYLGETALEALQEAVCDNRQLQQLELRENHIIDFSALNRVLGALLTLPSFSSLSLRGTQLDEENYQVLVQLISNSTSLNALCIPAWMGSLDYLAEGLDQNSSLLKLELRNLQFHDATIQTFAESVEKHATLQELRLGCNRAPPVDLKHLVQACRNSKSLNKLMFINFGLDGQHINCIGRMLEENQSIMSLDISGNDLRVDDLAVLSGYLNRRPKLKYLNVSQSPVHNWHPVVEQLRERVVMLKAEWF